jgi:hypothetical protein
VIVEPCARLGQLRDRWHRLRRRCGCQIAEDSRISETGLSYRTRFYGEEPFMDGIAESIDDLRAVEVNSYRHGDIERIEAGTIGERIAGLVDRMAAQRFEERMAGGNPFEAMLVRSFAIS